MSSRNRGPAYTARVIRLVLLISVGIAVSFWALWRGLLQAIPEGDLIDPWWILGSLGCMVAVVLLYLWLRLRPLDRLLTEGRGVGRRLDSDEVLVVARSMAVGPVFVVGPFSAGVVITLWLFISRILFGESINLASGLVTALLVPLLTGGLITSLLVRRALRPAWLELGLRRVPPVFRFGIVPRMVFSLLLVAQVAVAAILWIDCRASGIMVSQGGLLSEELAQPPFAVFVGLALLFLFAATTGGFLAGGIGRQMTALARRFDVIGSGELARRMEPLPVHSSTVAGNIAQAFNRLLTVQQRIQKQLGDYARRAVQSEKTRARFLRHVSHELRTPLNSIIGFSELLVQGVGGDLCEAQRESARFVNINGERLLRLINDILLMAQFDAARAVDDRETLSHGQLWQRVLSELQLTGGCRVLFDGSKEVLETQLRVDPRMWARALTALIELAQEHDRDKVIHLSVCRSADGELRWRVQLPQQVADSRVLDELFADNSLTLRGKLSLGLGLTRRIAELHGGEVGFLDDDHPGALVLRLPSGGDGGAD